MRTLSIAALQTAPIARDPDATLERLAKRAPAIRAAVPHVQLLVLPELHLAAVPGLLDEGDGYAESVAVQLPGALSDRLGEIARAAKLWIVAGSVYERSDEGAIHNTAIVVTPQGGLMARYRKVFPWRPTEHTVPGDGFVTFDIPEVGRIGLAICYDGFFPEVIRQLAWLGAEVVIQPTLTTTSDREAELIAARANAIFNQLYVVNLNASQPAALGRSVVVDPEGIVRAQAGEGEELLTDVLDLEAVERVRRFGVAGVSRMWEQLDSLDGDGPELPMYGGRIRPRPGAKRA
ncbi:MAG TPA: carbon-nitrogen hydrolase family protein [Solirubrobacterales bacterium]|nr:carbon-nitrogen hydrolase family protein [Solirubrobacterales bacterium]